ncbi:MAG: tyrosine-type recombinase/integrase [Firmicutes bacterium]|nr:tyrosine-type recombinase/integrase [Bacillota bacterium]
MPKKRGNREGTIARRTDGPGYRGAVSLGRDPTTGKVRRVWFYGKTRQEVAAKITKALQEIQAGTFVEPQKLTVGAWLDVWLNEYAKPRIRSTTFSQYEYLVRVHLKPGLEQIPLKKLRPETIQAFYNAKYNGGRIPDSRPSLSEEVLALLEAEKRPLGPKEIAARLNKPLSTVKACLVRMKRQGLLRHEGYAKYLPQGTSPEKTGPSSFLSSRTIRLMHAVLHNALDQAVKNGLISRNVAEFVSLPRQEKKEIRVLSPEDQERLLAVLDRHRLGTAFLLILATGLRRSEVLALRWSDLDLSAGTMPSSRGLVEIRDRTQEKGKRLKLAFQEVKTAAGRRTIPLPKMAITALEKHRARQDEEKAFLGERYQDQGLVFATETGRPIHPRNFAYVLERLLVEAGIPRVGLHALRHSFATRLLEAGEHPKVVQELLGHTQVSLTLDVYSHVSTALKRQAAEKIDALLMKAKKPLE